MTRDDDKTSIRLKLARRNRGCERRHAPSAIGGHDKTKKRETEESAVKWSCEHHAGVEKQKFFALKSPLIVRIHWMDHVRSLALAVAITGRRPVIEAFKTDNEPIVRCGACADTILLDSRHARDDGSIADRREFRERNSTARADLNDGMHYLPARHYFFAMRFASLPGNFP